MDKTTTHTLPWLTTLLEAEAKEKDRVLRSSEFQSDIKRLIEARFSSIIGQVNDPYLPRPKLAPISQFDGDKQASVIGILDTERGRRVEFRLSYHEGYLRVTAPTEGVSEEYRIFDIKVDSENRIEAILLEKDGISSTLDELIESVFTPFLFPPHIVRDAQLLSKG
jgi:hypothetical protein